MRKAIVAITCVLLIVASVSSQHKRPRKPRPKTDADLEAGLVPKDEVLFDKYDYLILPGWRFVANGQKDSQNLQAFAYYDRYRIVKGKETTRAWIKYVEKKDGLEQAHTLALEEFDCTGERSRTLQSADYSKDGKPLFTSSRAGEWDHIIPDSLAEELYQVICRGAKDEEQYEMEQAAKDFRLGRQSEKSESFEEARIYYEAALAFAPGNSKIISALARVRAKLKQP